MNTRDANERGQLRTARRKSGRKPAQLSGATHALLVELLNVTRLRGIDELVFELATAELQRRDTTPIIASEKARLIRGNSQ